MKKEAVVVAWLGLAGCHSWNGQTGIGVLCVEETSEQLVHTTLLGVCADLEPQQDINGSSSSSPAPRVENGIPRHTWELEVNVERSRGSHGCSRDVIPFDAFPLNSKFGFHHWTYGPDQKLDFFVDESGQLRDTTGIRRQRICAVPSFDLQHTDLDDTAAGGGAVADTGGLDTAFDTAMHTATD